jgi:UDP-N-acetylmuramoyl-tripeptide--D-alanyl-D-alanine ligase
MAVLQSEADCPHRVIKKIGSMSVFLAAELASAGVIGFDRDELHIERAVIDSREAREGDLFVCLKGAKTDGHLYAEAAIANGATSLLVEQSRLNEVKAQIDRQDRNAGSQNKKADSSDIAILSCADAVDTLQRLAAIRRRNYRGTIIAVAGSNGKTSTKEILASLLRCCHQNDAVFATPGNWNNHLGVPLSLLSLPDSASFAVLELGMNHAGEIEHLSRIVRPHHCVIPSIGFEHMEFFSSIEEVAAAELEVLAGMNGGVIVYPACAPGHSILFEQAARVNVRPILFELRREASSCRSDFDANGQAELRRADYTGSGFILDGRMYSSGEFVGPAMTSNILASVLLLQYAGYGNGLEPCTASLRMQVRGRFRTEKAGSTLLVDDTYNANPDSFRQSIRTLRELLPEGRLLCLAGHMAELGHFSEFGHRQVGEDLLEAGFADLIVCGNADVKHMLAVFRKTDDRKGKYFSDSLSLSTYLKDHPDQVMGFDGILVKGSRSAKMELVLPVLRELLAKG